jgi:hypothetical protein
VPEVSEEAGHDETRPHARYKTCRSNDDIYNRVQFNPCPLNNNKPIPRFNFEMRKMRNKAKRNSHVGRNKKTPSIGEWSAGENENTVDITQRFAAWYLRT